MSLDSSRLLKHCFYKDNLQAKPTGCGESNRSCMEVCAPGLAGAIAVARDAFALGLGDVRLLSPLNAPLDAEIELVNATAEDLASLEAKLASSETFARYGLDWPRSWRAFTVTRAAQPRRRDVLRIKSQRDRHRAVPHAAGRSELGARPPGARIHRAARSAGVRAAAAPARRRRSRRRQTGTQQRRIERQIAQQPPPEPRRRRPPLPTPPSRLRRRSLRVRSAAARRRVHVQRGDTLSAHRQRRLAGEHRVARPRWSPSTAQSAARSTAT